MFFRILQKDLKRKKLMNWILFLFMALASMFMASGLSNVVVALNGTEHYFDLAGVGDYMVAAIGSRDSSELRSALEEEPAVESYAMEEMLFFSGGGVSVSTGQQDGSNRACILQSLDSATIHFFDSSDQEIQSVAPGHVYVSGPFLKECGLKPGDSITITLENTSLSLIVAGKAKDAALGSEFAGNIRFLLNSQDMDKFYADEAITEEYYGQLVYIQTQDLPAVAAAMTDVPNVNIAETRAALKMSYVMDLIVAFSVLILSVCLIIVALVVLRFIITLTITEEYREIGVMKAIGLPNSRIRGLYLVKYFCLALAGAGVGLAASIPFGKIMMASVSENMVLGSAYGFGLNCLGAALVVVVIVLFAFGCTGKIKKITPVDAIRSGQTGERYRKKFSFRLRNCLGGNRLFLALTDIFSRPKQYAAMLTALFLCTSLVLMITNTVTTMRSDSLVTSFGARSELYIMDMDELMQQMAASREAAQRGLQQREAILAENGMDARMFQDFYYNYNVTVEDREYRISCFQGLGIGVDAYEYTQGTPPQNANEIAITPTTSQMTGAKIGDVLTVDFGTEQRACIVTAYFEHMIRMGQGIRLHQDAPTDFAYLASAMPQQISFDAAPPQAQLLQYRERIRALFGTEDVMTAQEYCVDCVGVVGTLEGVKALLVAITLVVTVLVTVLIEQSLVTNEKGQIALIKALGFGNRFVIQWHTLRFFLVALAAVLLAILLTRPLTQLCITPVFGMMGQTSIRYDLDYLQILVIYPAIILGVTVLSAWVTAQGSRRIQSRDTANNE